MPEAEDKLAQAQVIQLDPQKGEDVHAISARVDQFPRAVDGSAIYKTHQQHQQAALEDGLTVAELEALQKNTVFVTLTIDETGAVHNPVLSHPDHPASQAWGEVALEEAKQLRFIPATKDGQSVSVRLTTQVPVE